MVRLPDQVYQPTCFPTKNMPGQSVWGGLSEWPISRTFEISIIFKKNTTFSIFLIFIQKNVLNELKASL